MARIPAKEYLTKVESPLKEAPECKHNKGQWLVFWQGKYYSILPATQFQRDIWLGEAKRQIGEKKALQALRWLCRECGTVQEL